MQLKKPSALRLVLVVAALVLGGVGQLLVDSGNLRWAITPYVVAVAAMALAAANRPISSFAVAQRAPGRHLDAAGSEAVESRHRSWSLEQRLGLGGLAISLLMLAGALQQFLAGPPNTTAWYLYGASVTLVLLALPTLETRWTSLLRRLRDGHLVSFELQAVMPWAALGAILILAAAVRLYNLEELPAGLWFDEADNLAHARHIQQDPGSTPVFVTSTALPSLFLMPIAAAIDLTGITPATGRLIAVAFGLAGIVAVFLLVRLILGSNLALVAAILIAVMRWDINWSRIGMHGITAPLFAALTAYLALRALRTRRTSDFGYAGAALGLGMWFYTSFRLFPLVLGFMLVHYLVFERPEIRRFAAQVLLMGVVAAIVAAPVVQSAIVDSDEFFARTRATSVFSVMPFGEAVGEVWTSLGKHVLMFNYQGDSNPRHNLPDARMLDFVSGILLVLGLGVALGRWRNVALLSLPFWVMFMVLPGVLTLPWEAPQSLRSIGAVPAVVVVITLSFGVLWWVGRSAPWRAVRWATPLVLASLLAGIAFANVSTYFGDQARHPDVYASFSTDETLIANDMVRQQSRGYSLLTSRQFKYSLTTSLLANDPRYEVVRAPTGIPIDLDSVWLGTSIYLEPREASVFRLLREYYPDGSFQTVRPPGGGRVLYYSAVLSRQQLERPKGLTARYTYPDGTVREGTVLSTEGVSLQGIESQQVPFDLLWEGALHVIEPGEYTLTLDGDTDAQVSLDGRRILWEARRSIRIEPAVGLHSLEITARVEDRAGVLRLLWQPPGDQFQPISARHLYHGSVRPVGLAGRLYAERATPPEAELVPDALRVTPAMDAFYYDPVVPEPYLAVWEGTLDVPASGAYRFKVGGAGTVKLFLDGELRLQSPPVDFVGPEALSALGVGRHRIRVEYYSGSPLSEFEVLWAPPGVALRPIPIERLSPAPEHMFRVLSAAEE